MRLPRVAVITMGQSPRPAVLTELFAAVGPLASDEFGALDDVPAAELARNAPVGGEPTFFSVLRDGSNAIVATRFIEERIAQIVARLDDQRYDLIVVAGTALFAPLRARTPIVHGHRAVESWITALTANDIVIGLIFPLPQQGAQLGTFQHGTRLQSAHATISGGHGAGLSQSAAGVAGADIVLMHSVGYDKAMARQVMRESGRPVVTARGILAGALQSRLSEVVGQAVAPPRETYTGAELLRRLTPPELLTPRESDVLAQVLEGAANKLIARSLEISHRTVEIHRARAMAKLGATSAVELIRRALRAEGHDP